jgi:hypothetical protein
LKNPPSRNPPGGQGVGPGVQEQLLAAIEPLGIADGLVPAENVEFRQERGRVGIREECFGNLERRIGGAASQRFVAHDRAALHIDDRLIVRGQAGLPQNGEKFPRKRVTETLGTALGHHSRFADCLLQTTLEAGTRVAADQREPEREVDMRPR